MCNLDIMPDCEIDEEIQRQNIVELKRIAGDTSASPDDRKTARFALKLFASIDREIAKLER